MGVALCFDFTIWRGMFVCVCVTCAFLLSYTTSSFLSILRQDFTKSLSCPGWAWNCNPPTSASCNSGITQCATMPGGQSHDIACVLVQDALEFWVLFPEEETETQIQDLFKTTKPGLFNLSIFTNRSKEGRKQARKQAGYSMLWLTWHDVNTYFK